MAYNKTTQQKYYELHPEKKEANNQRAKDRYQKVKSNLTEGESLRDALKVKPYSEWSIERKMKRAEYNRNLYRNNPEYAERRRQASREYTKRKKNERVQGKNESEDSANSR